MQIRALRNLLPLFLALGLGACDRVHKTEANVQRYQVRGIVRGIAPDRSTVEIEHEAIPDFMPSMTMPFSAGDPREIARLQLGDAISFRLDVTASEFSIAEIKKIDVAEVHLSTRTMPSAAAADSGHDRLKEGDALPAFALTNEAGEKISAETLRGHPTVLTFIFTRCPMPNFCPRMAQNFSDLQKAIQSGEGLLAQVHLLSVTLDPEFDTPAVLKNYGQQNGADPRVWSFATGEASAIDQLTKAFAVYRENAGGTISHGLTTALIDGDGKVRQIWRGNAWKTEDIIRAVETPR